MSSKTTSVHVSEKMAQSCNENNKHILIRSVCFMLKVKGLNNFFIPKNIMNFDFSS
jgi:hypothetical protein